MSQFDVYKVKTENADWQGICSLNGIDFDSFWTKQEFTSLAKLLKPGESVLGFTAGMVRVTVSGKTTLLGKDSWLVALTDMRLLLVTTTPLKGTVKSKSIDIKKVSGMVASQNRALGQLVIVSNGGIVTIENSMVNTVKSIESLFNKIKDIVKPSETTNQKEIVPNTETLNSQEQAVQEPRQMKVQARKEPVANPFSDELDEYEEKAESDVNSVVAVLVAFFFGGVGVHDFVWGRGIFGIEKIAFTIAAWRSAANGHEIISALFVLGLTVWIFIDILRMLNGKYFKGRTYSRIPHFFRIVTFVMCGIGILFSVGSLLSEISDNSKKDYGGHIYHDEIVMAYNQNAAQAKVKYENRRFSIIGQVGSVEKNVWGDYLIKLESGGLGYANPTNKVKEMDLYFSSRQSKEILRLQKGNRFAASCIGRGLTFGTYTAEKCILKHVVQYK